MSDDEQSRSLLTGTRLTLVRQALPSDTAVRFVLLLVAVAAASLYLFQALWIPLNGKRFGAALVACGFDRVEVPTLQGVAVQRLESQASCLFDMTWDQGLFSVAGVVAVLVVAWLLYRMRPLLRDRRARLVAVDQEEAAALLAEVDLLARSAGVATPRVTLDAPNARVQAFAYGAGHDLRVGLTGGLVVQQVLDPPTFRAVIRHELGHLANRDVPWTYFSVSAWWSFLLVAVTPVVLVFAVFDRSYVFRVGWRILVLAALVAVMLTGLLRAREAEADQRAAEWGSEAALMSLLSAGSMVASRRPSWLRTHPDPAQRRDMVAHPERMWTTSLVGSIAVGLTAGAAFDAVASLSSAVLSVTAAVLVAAIPMSALLAGAVCIASWRLGLLGDDSGESPARGLRLGAGLGIGLAIAPLLGLQAARGAFVNGADGWWGYAMWGLGVVVLTSLMTQWCVDSARLRAATVVTAARVRTEAVAHFALVWFLFALLLAYIWQVLRMAVQLGPSAFVREWGAGGPDLPWDSVMIFSGAAWFQGWLIVAAILVTGYGVLTLAGSSRVSLFSSDAPPRRWWLTLVVGWAVGLFGGATIIATRMIGGEQSGPVRDSSAFVVEIGLRAILTTVVASVVATAAGAMLLRGRWWILGLGSGLMALLVSSGAALFAAFASDCGMLPSRHPLCVVPNGEVWGFLLGWPAAAAFPLALCAGAAVGVLRAAWSGGVPHRAAPEPLTYHREASRWRAGVVGVSSVAVTAALGGAMAVSLAALTVPVVLGRGFSIIPPSGWSGEAQATTDAVVFTTSDKTVEVLFAPLDASLPPPAIDAPAIDVAGHTARLLRRAASDEEVVELFRVDGSRGPVSIIVHRTQGDVAQRASQVEALLAAVEWTN